MNWLSQVVVVTELNLRTVRQRLAASLVAMVGVAGVVGVFVAVLSMGEGFAAVMKTTGSPETVIVLRSGSDSEMMSVLSREETRVILEGPGVARASEGPAGSAECFLTALFPRRSTGTDANVSMRGVQPSSFAVRKKFDIVAGRRFEFGRAELIIGEGAAREFAGLDIGQQVRLGDTEWTVVGIFSTGGSVADSEIWADAEVLLSAFRRTSFQSVYARLNSAEDFDRFRAALTSDPRLNVRVERETDFYLEQSRLLRQIVTGLGNLVALLMGIGAVFGALNTMYSAVSARTREIATLRALGFRGSPVAVSVLLESLVLALAGGALGGAAAYIGFNGFTASTLNWQSFTQVAFAFAVTPKLLLQGLIYSLVMGLIGGLFPAIRAARLPVAAALREL
ncbi:MAG: ABC transporter permease [Terriglobia bacterium]